MTNHRNTRHELFEPRQSKQPPNDEEDACCSAHILPITEETLPRNACSREIFHGCCKVSYIKLT